MIPSVGCWVFLGALAFHYAEAQRQCNGTVISQAASMPAQYPPAGQVANLVDGDEAGKALFNAIMANNATALSIAPHTMQNGAFNVTYDYGNDPDCWWSATTCHTPKDPTLPEDYHFCPTPETWGLSIDDGPTCAHTPLYDMLQQYNQLASLYYIGVNVLANPAEAQRGFNDHHEICVHTWSHPYMTTLTNEEVFAELYYTKRAIKDVIGYSPRCWRPPYGDVDDRVRTIAAALDLRTHLWTKDTDDWEVLAEGEGQIQQNYAGIINGDYSTSGIVVLTHELNDETVKMLVEEYPNILNAFKHVVPVSTCMNDTTIFAEEGAPDLPTFDSYLTGYRGQNRTQNLFYKSSNITFIGDSFAASFEGTVTPSGSGASSAASASASSTSSTAPSSSSHQVFSATYKNTKSGVTMQSTTSPSGSKDDSSSALRAASVSLAFLLPAFAFIFFSI